MSDQKQGLKAGEFVAGVIVGGLIGAAVALLTTPKTGKEMRRDLKDGIEIAKERSNELVQVVKSQTGETLEKLGETQSKVQNKWIEIKSVWTKDKEDQLGI